MLLVNSEYINRTNTKLLLLQIIVLIKILFKVNFDV